MSGVSPDGPTMYWRSKATDFPNKWRIGDQEEWWRERWGFRPENLHFIPTVSKLQPKQLSSRSPDRSDLTLSHELNSQSRWQQHHLLCGEPPSRGQTPASLCCLGCLIAPPGLQPLLHHTAEGQQADGRRLRLHRPSPG
jgi:hypothetical protein